MNYPREAESLSVIMIIKVNYSFLLLNFVSTFAPSSGKFIQLRKLSERRRRELFIIFHNYLTQSPLLFSCLIVAGRTDKIDLYEQAIERD